MKDESSFSGEVPVVSHLLLVSVCRVCRYPVNPLPYHLLKAMFTVGCRPIVYQVLASVFDDAESPVNFQHQKKSRIRCDLGSGKINDNGPVEIRLYRLFLCFTISEHRLNLQHD
jgi:hypothetical protein